MINANVIFVLDKEKMVPSSSTFPETTGIVATLPCCKSRCGLSGKKIPSARGDQAKTRDYTINVDVRDLHESKRIEFYLIREITRRLVYCSLELIILHVL